VAFLSVSLTNFRNIENTKIDLLAREVYFVGENGQGKSNLLESLYISSYGSSFRTRNENEIIKNGENFYSVNSFYKAENEKMHTLSILYEKGRKKIEKNAKRITDRKDLLNTIPCVLFCHDDLEFAVGEPERRRFFIDQTLSMYDVLYIDVIRNYKKILKTRNLLLKEKNYSLLPVYDIQLVEKGLEIIKKRDIAIFKFNQIFSVLYEKITGIESKIMRFPGGSSNTVSKSYSKGIMTYLSNEVLNRGYHYFDWNVSSLDAGGAKTKEQVYKNVVNNLKFNRANIVLMHDFENNYKTLNALSDIIDYGLANGYEFLSIDMTTPLVRHGVNN